MRIWAMGLLALMMTACGTQQSTNSTPENNLKNSDDSSSVLRVATDGAFAPFNYTQADGTLAGFDIDLANALCAKLNKTCQISAHEWDGIIPALKADKYDAIIGAMAVTEERKTQVDFSDVYFSSPLVFVAKNDASFDPTNQVLLDNSTIGVQRATTAYEWISQNHPKADIKSYDTLDNSLADLAAGRVDAALADKMAVISWLNADKSRPFAIKGDDINVGDDVAIAVNKNTPDLLAKLNDALGQLRTDGTYDKLVVQYFGQEALSSQQQSTTK